MIEKIKNNKLIKNIFNSRNIGLYLFLIISLSVAWSTARIIQKNYELQKEIVNLSQQVALQDQINKNQKLKNQYYATDAYLEIAARKYFVKSFPGEKLYTVPKEVALTYAKPEVDDVSVASKKSKKHPFVLQNWIDWVNFFQGKHKQQTEIIN